MHPPSIFLFASAIVGIAVSNPTTCHAGLMIDISDASAGPGESGFVDVFVSSDSTDSFQKFLLEFNVSGPAHAVAPINFVESSIVAPQLSAVGPDYIFLDDSAEKELFQIGVDWVTDPAGAPNAFDLINVQDETDSLSDRTITSGEGPFLLARLNFAVPVNATVGQNYDVTLLNAEFYESNDFFHDFPLSFSSTPGSITITASAVPEPSSIVILAIGSVVAVGYRRRKQPRTSAFPG